VTDYATFLASATLSVLVGRRADVTVCLSTPPLVAVLGRLARLLDSRFVYKVEDLYPDVAVRLGAVRRGSLGERFFAALSAQLLRSADAVVALDEAMARELHLRGARRVEVIPNWADGEAIRPEPSAGDAIRREQGLKGRFVVLYSGNLGLAHRFDAVCETARSLAKTLSDVFFLFVGAGPRLEEVETGVRGLPNVRLLPYQPRERLGELYNAADIHLVTLRDEVAGLLVPSKYPAALAAGKPVLQVGGRGADLWQEIQDEDVGWVCEHRAEEVMGAIHLATSDADSVRQKGERARDLFERKYTRSACTEAWYRLLRDVAGE
jgi:glycosyltransferase involved in cell wall biosynthesis